MQIVILKTVLHLWILTHIIIREVQPVLYMVAEVPLKIVILQNMFQEETDMVRL